MLSSRDSLTPLPGHSAFLDALAGLRALCRRNGHPLSLMMLDFDRFRECNERHSPAFGDHVLRWFARILESVCRRSDIVTRYQSDRFIAALADVSGLDDAAPKCAWHVQVCRALTSSRMPSQLVYHLSWLNHPARSI